LSDLQSVRSAVGVPARLRATRTPTRSARRCLTMSKSCKGLLKELYTCLEDSRCVKEEGKPMVECAKAEDSSISEECKGVRYTYFQCKRGMVDMRSRIRGNKGY